MAGDFWKSSHYEQWILDKQDLLRNRAEDLKILTEEEYQKTMIYFVNYIHSLVNDGNLGCREHMIATACVFFRRFYAVRSLKDIDPFLMAHTCLFLASRVDECGIIASKSLYNALTMTSKTRPWFPTIPEHEIKGHMRLINEAEFYLLEILDCCLIVYHPYRTLLQIMTDVLKENPKEKEVVFDAWKIVNDSLRSDACLLFPPHQIAVASFMISVTLNKKENEFKKWFQELNTDYDEIFEIIKMIMHCYKLQGDILDSPENSPKIKALFSKIPKPMPQLPQIPNIGNGSSMDIKMHFERK
ncbi:hypothetical protein FO519_002622 [Halicephalobus sp. NKZ332]|nr:hypothetical protein FO519_002622 [Halicephalobus sp. NKZ332]